MHGNLYKISNVCCYIKKINNLVSVEHLDEKSGIVFSERRYNQKLHGDIGYRGPLHYYYSQVQYDHRFIN